MKIAIVGRGLSVAEFFHEEEAYNRVPRNHDYDLIWAITTASMRIYSDLTISMRDTTIAAREMPVCWDNTLKRSRKVLVTKAPPGDDRFIEFPLERYVEEFKQYPRALNYQTTSVSYGICYAMMEGATKIGLYGCDFAWPNRKSLEDDASYQSCAAFWIAIAMSRDIEVHVTPGSTLLSSRDRTMYGYGAEEQPNFRELLR